VKRLVLRSTAFVRATRRIVRKYPHAAGDVQGALELLTEDAFHPQLRTHKLKGKLEGSWACSAGYYLRIISGDQRIAALIADPGQWDQLESIHAGLPLPPELMDRLSDVDPEELDPHLAGLAAHPLLHWRLIQRGLWVHGLKTLSQYVIDMSRYRLSDVAGSISCPTLVAWAEGDAIGAGAECLYEALGCPKTLVRFTAAEGANGHCEGWNRSRFDQQVFDWLDDPLQVTRRR